MLQTHPTRTTTNNRKANSEVDFIILLHELGNLLKVSLHLITQHAMEMYGGADGHLHAFLTSELHEGGHFHVSVILPPGETGRVGLGEVIKDEEE
jgi:hypothetical protein